MKTVYVLELQNEGKYYVGKTNDFEKRIKQHNNIIPLIDKGIILLS